tara:strand:+ start:460 stop:1029 length:570 start_codon:yes stop_codon:yes gene_type:complete
MIVGCERLWFVLYCVFIGAVLLTAGMGLVPNVIGDSGLDKIGHFILVGTFAWLFNVAFRLGEINLVGLRIFVGTVVVVTVVTLEEIAQLWIPTRRFELIDLLADYLGIATAEIVLRRQSLLGRLKKVRYGKIFDIARDQRSKESITYRWLCSFVVSLQTALHRFRGCRDSLNRSIRRQLGRRAARRTVR